MLKNALDNQLRSFRNSHAQTAVRVGSAKFSGLDRIHLENVHFRSGPLAVRLRSCTVRIAFWNMLGGRVRPKRLEMNDIGVDIRQTSTRATDQDRLASGENGKPSADRPAPYSAQVNRWLELVFQYAPDSLKINRLTIRSDIDRIQQTLFVPRLAIQSPVFDTKVEIKEPERNQEYRMSGSIDRRQRRFAFRLAPASRGKPPLLPFIHRQWGLRIGFHSVFINLKSNGLRDGSLQLAGMLAVNGLTLNHHRLAAEDIRLPNVGFDFVLRIGDDSFELDDQSRVSFNRLSFRPYVKFRIRPTRQFTLKLDKTEFKAADFFGSLPVGLFRTLAGIKTSGELAFRLSLFIDFTHPESIQLDSALEKGDFKIVRFGRTDFRAVNGPFLYTAYEKDRALRSFMVGPENPNFRPLDQIPPFLKNAVLISEDGAFFGHKGFLLGPIKESIAANIREKRFVRGASTISMQLAKNLYLNLQKTIARKLEEMIITWLIEENRLVSKERMFEIYLNVIEWGPLIYGAQEAARFYFDKDVANLTLAEAIFMASILPRPRHFMGSFEPDRRLRSWLKAYYADVSFKMLNRGWIAQSDFDRLVPEIDLKGPARFLLEGTGLQPDAPPAEEAPDGWEAGD